MYQSGSLAASRDRDLAIPYTAQIGMWATGIARMERRFIDPDEPGHVKPLVYL